MQNPLNANTTLVFLGSADLLPILSASRYNWCVLASAKYPRPQGLATLGQCSLVGISHLPQWNYFIEVQYKHIILQTLAQPTLNRIILSKMHFPVKVQLFPSSHLTGGNSGSGITVGLVTRCSIVRTLSRHTVGRGRARSGRQRELSTCHISPSSPPW